MWENLRSIRVLLFHTSFGMIKSSITLHYWWLDLMYYPLLLEIRWFLRTALNAMSTASHRSAMRQLNHSHASFPVSNKRSHYLFQTCLPVENGLREVTLWRDRLTRGKARTHTHIYIYHGPDVNQVTSHLSPYSWRDSSGKKKKNRHLLSIQTNRTFFFVYV